MFAANGFQSGAMHHLTVTVTVTRQQREADRQDKREFIDIGIDTSSDRREES